MNDKANNNGKELATFGARDDVRELADRLQLTMPGARKLEPKEAVTLAQISVAHGLDPFNGEAWFIPGSGVMVGIKGLRKAARRKAREEGGSFWTEFKRVDPEEYNEPKTSSIWECVLRDSVTSQAWAKTVHTMTEAGVPYKDAVSALGPPPAVTGVGIARPEEKSRMDFNARGRKRAEADAIKQRYDVDFIGATIADDEIEEPSIFEPKPREKKSPNQLISELGYDIDGDYTEPKETQEELDIAG